MRLETQIGGSSLEEGSAARVNITPSTAGRPISLGVGAATGLALDDFQLNTNHAAEVNIGSGSAGALTFGAFAASDTFATTMLSLQTGAAATVTGRLDLKGGLSVAAPGGIALNGGTIATAGPQTYDSGTAPILLGADTVLDTTAGNGAIALIAQVEGGANSLTLTSGSGAQTLNGVKTTGDLILETTGTVALNTGTYTITGGGNPYVFPAVTTNGTLTLGHPTRFGAVTLAGDTTIIGTGNTAIQFASTVNGGFALTVNTAGTTAFDGTVGGTTPLASLTTDQPGTTDLNGGAVTTSGAQTYGDPVILTANTILASTGVGAAGDITFASTIDGGFGLTVTAGGTSAFNGAVGGTTPLASLDATGAAIALNAPITASGTLGLNATMSGLSVGQNLTADTVALRAAGVIAQTGGTIAATNLTGSSTGGAALTGANQIANLGTFTNAGSGALTVSDGRSLMTRGPLSSGGVLSLRVTSGALTLAAGASSTGVDLRLVA
jgi:hypothetical protein